MSHIARQVLSFYQDLLNQDLLCEHQAVSWDEIMEAAAQEKIPTLPSKKENNEQSSDHSS